VRIESFLFWRGRGAPPARRDGAALGFGVAFLVFGLAGLARAAGLVFDSAWLYPLAFLCLGAAGLLSVLMWRNRG
jgi:hypothetical protein